MCGIGGIYLPGHRELTQEHAAALGTLAECMRLRGPDASGSKTAGHVGLVHTRLSIIDLDERSNQPMESDDWILSYNGEIYNFRQVRRELEGKYAFRTTSDTEVLLLAIQEWGLEQALSKCAGMFAFLAYDKRQRTLYAVRDRLGIKPLFLTRFRDGSFYFASSPASLAKALPRVGWREYRPALASYFILGAPFTRMSVFDGIERVEPAHYVRISPDGTMTTRRYWEPRYRSDFTLDDLIEVIREYQISDVKSALFLSGGVDSTFLAAATSDLDCFHLKSSEASYAREVARKYDRRFVEVGLPPDDYVEIVKRACTTHGEPYMSCAIPFAVSEAIAREGYKMAIIANGADELFHGYPRTPIPEYRPAYLGLHEEKTYKWFHEQISHIFRDSRNFTIEEFEDCIPSLVEIGNNALEKYCLPDFPPSASHRWFELMTYVLHDLNATLDAASMANSIEVRVPFLDHRIVEGVLSWSGESLVTERYGRKTPLKRWLSRDFPMSFFNRPKVGFSIDKGILSGLSELSERSFLKLKNSSFIKLNGTRYGHYDRDLIYLKQSCFVYDVWKSCIPH